MLARAGSTSACLQRSQASSQGHRHSARSRHRHRDVGYSWSVALEFVHWHMANLPWNALVLPRMAKACEIPKTCSPQCSHVDLERDVCLKSGIPRWRCGKSSPYPKPCEVEKGEMRPRWGSSGLHPDRHIRCPRPQNYARSVGFTDLHRLKATRPRRTY